MASLAVALGAFADRAKRRLRGVPLPGEVEGAQSEHDR